MREYTRQVLAIGAVGCIAAHAHCADDVLTTGVCDAGHATIESIAPVVDVSIDTTEVFDSTRPDRWSAVVGFIDTLLMAPLAPDMTLSDDAVDVNSSGAGVFSTRLSLRSQ